MSAPIYSQVLKNPTLVDRWCRAVSIFAKAAPKNSTGLRRDFFNQARLLDAITLGEKAKVHFCGLPFESIEGDLHRMWDAHGRSDWSSVRCLVVQGWQK